MAAKTFKVSGLSTGVTYTVSKPTADTWITVSQSGDTVTVTPEATAYASTTANRTSTITVTASDGATTTLVVTQYKKSAILLAPTTLAFDAAGN